MSLMKSLVVVGAAVAAVSLGSAPAWADPINSRPIVVNEPGANYLQSVFDNGHSATGSGEMVDPFQVNDVGSGSDQNGAALWFPVGGAQGATIVIEVAGNAPTNKLGIYSAANSAHWAQLYDGASDAGDPVTFTFFEIAGVGFVQVGALPAVAFNLDEGFGFYLELAGGVRFYTEDSENQNGVAQALAFKGNGDGIQSIRIVGTTPASDTTVILNDTDWVIAFEDLRFATSDQDFNDFVFLARNIAATPEPATLALLSLGALGVGVRRARRARAAKSQ